MRAEFLDLGYVSPVPVLSLDECRQFLEAATGPLESPPLDWEKGRAVTSRAMYELATHPAILNPVADLLGGHVILWGAALLRRAPGAVHPWHSDIETAAPNCRAISVWMGLENTTRESALQVVPCSHRFGITLQEERQKRGVGRDRVTSEEAVRWARERDSRCRLEKLDLRDGEAVLFHGHLWHHSDNRTEQARMAVLLQYASSDEPIQLPDFSHLDWPFRSFPAPRPPCLLVRGEAPEGVNRIVKGPVSASAGRGVQLSTRVNPLRLPLEPHETEGWKPYQQFGGSTAGLTSLNCHASTLDVGCIPHPPHKHQEEELLLVLAGELDVLLPNASTAGDERRRLRSGEFVYYPPWFPHTIESVGMEPANYLMFKWHTEPHGVQTPLSYGFHTTSVPETSGTDGFQPRLLFQGPTPYLRKLHCHVSTLAPDAGYAPHHDAHDVAIVVLDGEIETAGQRLAKHTVVFFPAGEPHGMHNPGDVTASYLVIEFHGNTVTRHASPPAGPTSRTMSIAGRAPTLLAKVTDPQRWRRKLSSVWQRLRQPSAMTASR